MNNIDDKQLNELVAWRIDTQTVTNLIADLQYERRINKRLKMGFDNLRLTNLNNQQQAIVDATFKESE